MKQEEDIVAKGKYISRIVVHKMKNRRRIDKIIN